MTKIVAHTEIIERAGLLKAVEAQKASEGESQYFTYTLSDSRIVQVQCTASNLMEDVTHFATGDQAKLFGAIADELPEPGDSLMIVDDEKGKRRAAFIARVKGEKGVINLLITR